MYKLTADSGSTKTVWVLADATGTKCRVTTIGINPVVMGEEQVAEALADVPKAIQLQNEDACTAEQVTEIEFYGSGCRPDKEAVMQRLLSQAFPNATQITVGSDIVGAARALCGANEGIACILGTGSNSCLWDGQRIVQNTPCLGYVLGDEGGGAVMGKLLLNALYKGRLGEEMIQEFESDTSLNINSVITAVYRDASPNRFLASLCPFISKNIDDSEGLQQLVMENFRAFVRNNILPYKRPDLPLNFVGSVAHFFEPWLRRAVEAEGLKVGKIMQAPI